jgi:ABC-2 type transport system permease protein
VSAEHRAELRRFWQLTVSLAVTDFKLRYYGNALGYFWSLIKPLMLFGIIYFVFTEVLPVGNTIPYFPAYLITALVLFNFFSEVTSQSVASLVAHEPLIRKVPMPILAIPFSIALRSLFNLLLNMPAVFLFIALAGVHVTTDWLQFPLLIVALVIFSTALGLLLANLYVPFRDMGQIAEVFLQVLFWGTPVIYTIQQVPANVREWLMINPLAVIMTQMRHTLIDPSAPSAIGAIGGASHLIWPLTVLLATVFGAVVLYRRMAPRLAEQL